MRWIVENRLGLENRFNKVYAPIVFKLETVSREEWFTPCMHATLYTPRLLESLSRFWLGLAFLKHRYREKVLTTINLLCTINTRELAKYACIFANIVWRHADMTINYTWILEWGESTTLSSNKLNTETVGQLNRYETRSRLIREFMPFPNQRDFRE